MILEVWGNGTDVIIKYKKNGFSNIWFAASKWFMNNNNMNNSWLKRNGFRRIKYEN